MQRNGNRRVVSPSCHADGRRADRRRADRRRADRRHTDRCRVDSRYTDCCRADSDQAIKGSEDLVVFPAQRIFRYPGHSLLQDQSGRRRGRIVNPCSLIQTITCQSGCQTIKSTFNFKYSLSHDSLQAGDFLTVLLKRKTISVSSLL